MNKNERLIQFFDLELFGKTYTRGLTGHTFNSPENLSKLVTRMQNMLKSGTVKTQLTARSRKVYTLTAIKETNDYWVFLIRQIDTQAKNVVRNDQNASISTREVLKFGATQDGKFKGLESSAHLLVLKNRNSVRKHLCLFEKPDSFNFQDVTRFFNTIFASFVKSEPATFTKQDRNTPNKKIKIYPKLGFLGHPSKSFFDELSYGTITSITLTSGPDVVSGYDQNSHSELQRASITMGVKKDDIALWGGNRKYLDRAIAIADSLEVPEVRIAFKDENGAPHSAKVDSASHKLLDADRYIRKTLIKCPAGSTSETKINDEVVQKIIELVK